jgi:hypothetical protein
MRTTLRLDSGASSGWAAPRVAVAAVVTLTMSTTALAQQSQDTLANVVRFLVTNQSVQTGDFVKDRAAAEAASDTIGRALLVSLSTLPTSASSAGFTYRFNPELGTLERTSASFGPSFVERAATSGRGRAAFGATWDYAAFNKLDGRPLNDATLVTTANRFTDENAAFDVETLSIDVHATVVTGFATVGVTDRFDVSAAVPFVWLDLDGVRHDTYRGTTVVQAQATASTSGFGDAALRAKYAFVVSRNGALAVGAEVRLPTGRSEDLLGAGFYGRRVLAIGSIEGDHVALHGNVGLGWGGISDEFSYAGALTVAASPRVTMAAELTGRHLSDVARTIDVTAPHPSIPGVETTRLGVAELGLDVVDASGSVKWNPTGTWLVRASVLVPTRDAGLTSRARITAGLDYSFGQ